MKSVWRIAVCLLAVLLLSSSPLAADSRTHWVAEYTYDLPIGMTWEEGPHTYMWRFTWSNPDPQEWEWEWHFSVSNAEPLYDGFAVLRMVTVLVRIPPEEGTGCTTVDQIHPNQPTRFHIANSTGKPMTRQEAIAFFSGFTATVSWDGGEPVLLRLNPLKRSQTLDVQRRWCLWTLFGPRP
jgi:hypothetical protein